MLDFQNTISCGRSNSYFSGQERMALACMLVNGISISRISATLQRSRNTIYRELKRAGATRCRSVNGRLSWIYDPCLAQSEFEERQKTKGRPFKLDADSETLEFIRSKIKQDKWSLEACIGYLAAHSPEHELISLTTAYSYFANGRLGLSQSDMPRQKKIRKAGCAKRRPKRKIGKSIEERDPQILTRDTFGHWEGDLVVGTHKGGREVVLTLIERKTRYVIAKKLPGKEARYVVGALDSLERKYKNRFCEIFKSITFDNGTEFSNYEGMIKSVFKTKSDPRCEIYYAHPASPGERGSNENANGLLRRFGVHKGQNIEKVSNRGLKAIVGMINGLPRQILGYATAHEAFMQEVMII